MNAKVTIISKVDSTSELPLPSYSSKIRAGFPSPADDYVEEMLDINQLLIQHPSASYIVRVDNDADSMIGIGIFPSDYLVVDRSIEAANGDVVIAEVNGEFTVKELSLGEIVALVPRNDNYPIIKIGEGTELALFGVVVGVVRKMSRHK